jgi:hypothetical protein
MFALVDCRPAQHGATGRPLARRRSAATPAPAGARNGRNMADSSAGRGSHDSVSQQPPVIERFAAHTPGLPARAGGRCARTCGSSSGAPRRSLPRGMLRALCPGRERWLPGAGGRTADPLAADAHDRAGLPGRRRRADPRRPAACPRHRHRRAVRRRHRDPQGRSAAGSAGAGPLPRPAADLSTVRRRTARRNRMPVRTGSGHHLIPGR